MPTLFLPLSSTVYSCPYSLSLSVFFSDSSPAGFLRLCPLSFSCSLYVYLSHLHSCPLFYPFIFFTWRFPLKCCQMHANIQRHTHSVYPYCLGLLKSSYYHLPPLPQTAVCTYVCCVVVGGLVCAVEGYNFVVNKRWKSWWPAEFRARCSPTAS